MKKIIFLITAILLTGCTPATQSSDAITVYTTFYVMSEFVQDIGGDYVEVHQLVPNGAEAHDYEPKTSDVAGVADADMFVYNSDYMEHYADDIIESASNENLVVVEAARDIDFLVSEQGQDPHTWLSLENAQRELDAILQALIQLDSEHEDYYQSNYDNYVSKLQVLDQEYASRLAGFDKREIVVEHEAFAYLCADYDIIQNSVTGITIEGEATSRQIAQTIDFINENEIKVIFYQESLSSDIMATIVNETGCELLPLNTIASLSNSDIEAGKNYISLMEDNLENIVYAFEKIN